MTHQPAFFDKICTIFQASYTRTMPVATRSPNLAATRMSPGSWLQKVILVSTSPGSTRCTFEIMGAHWTLQAIILPSRLLQEVTLHIVLQ
jgi:hypothetical protein